MIAPANFTASAAPLTEMRPTVRRTRFWRLRVALRIVVFAVVFVAIFGWELLRALVLGNKATSEAARNE